MINPQKVQTMSRKTLFEIDEGREALKLKKYCEDMPVWKSMMHSTLAGFLLYLLVLLLVVAAEYDWFVQLIETIGIVWVVVLAAISMAVIVAAYALLSDFIVRKKYNKVKSMLCRYRTSVMRLDQIKREQALLKEVETDDDKY